MTQLRSNDTIVVQCNASIPFTFTVKEWDETTKGYLAKDISACTTKQAIMTKPSGQQVTKTLSFVNTGADGQLTCTPTSAELSMPGMWEIQVYLVAPSWSTKSAIVKMEVLRNA